MDGWMDGWMRTGFSQLPIFFTTYLTNNLLWMDGWMDGWCTRCCQWMNGWIDGWMDGVLVAAGSNCLLFRRRPKVSWTTHTITHYYIPPPSTTHPLYFSSIYPIFILFSSYFHLIFILFVSCFYTFCCWVVVAQWVEYLFSTL
jgi:hypothetical protein